MANHSVKDQAIACVSMFIILFSIIVAVFCTIPQPQTYKSCWDELHADADGLVRVPNVGTGVVCKNPFVVWHTTGPQTEITLDFGWREYTFHLKENMRPVVIVNAAARLRLVNGAMKIIGGKCMFDGTEGFGELSMLNMSMWSDSTAVFCSHEEKINSCKEHDADAC